MEVYKYFNDYNRDRNVVDAMQLELKCCGADGPDDYSVIWGNGSLPLSCCGVYVHFKRKKKFKNFCMIKNDNYYKDGCVENMLKSYEQYIKHEENAAVESGAISLIAATLAIILMYLIKRRASQNLTYV